IPGPPFRDGGPPHGRKAARSAPARRRAPRPSPRAGGARGPARAATGAAPEEACCWEWWCAPALCFLVRDRLSVRLLADARNDCLSVGPLTGRRPRRRTSMMQAAASADASSFDETQPLVSVGIPVFNGEKLIRAAIDSVLAQNHVAFEIVISDN